MGNILAITLLGFTRFDLYGSGGITHCPLFNLFGFTLIISVLFLVVTFGCHG